jgi:hypothetical protein
MFLVGGHDQSNGEVYMILEHGISEVSVSQVH